MLLQLRATPSSLLGFPNGSLLSIYTPGWSGRMWSTVSFLRKQHDTIFLSKVRHANHYITTASPLPLNYSMTPALDQHSTSTGGVLEWRCFRHTNCSLTCSSENSILEYIITALCQYFEICQFLPGFAGTLLLPTPLSYSSKAAPTTGEAWKQDAHNWAVRSLVSTAELWHPS